jgi:hypothetical protein
MKLASRLVRSKFVLGLVVLIDALCSDDKEINLT